VICDVFDFLFGCWHKNYSFPITARAGKKKSPAAALTGTYVVCLDCGKEFPYDWKEMKVIRPETAIPSPTPVQVPSTAEWETHKAA
jgi:hypothetical protein